MGWLLSPPCQTSLWSFSFGFSHLATQVVSFQGRATFFHLPHPDPHSGPLWVSIVAMESGLKARDLEESSLEGSCSSSFSSFSPVLLQCPPLPSLWDHEVGAGLTKKKGSQGNWLWVKSNQPKKADANKYTEQMDKTAGLGNSCGQALWPKEKKKKEPPQHWPGSTTKDEVLLWLWWGGNPQKGLPFCLPFLCPCVPEGSQPTFCAALLNAKSRVFINGICKSTTLGVWPGGRLRWDRCSPCPSSVHPQNTPLLERSTSQSLWLSRQPHRLVSFPALLSPLQLAWLMRVWKEGSHFKTCCAEGLSPQSCCTP